MQDNEKQQAMMRKVEGLLAKAESTEFEAEREAFMKKAQELMTTYAIEDAMLRKHTSTEAVTVEHVQINMDQIKYTKAMAILINGIANAQNAYCVLTRKSGNKRGYAFATIFGTPHALDCVLMLVTSLHHQLEVALRDTPIPEGEHGKTFRNNFVVSFSQTVVRRLNDAKEDALREVAGSSLVLASEFDKANAKAHEHFGRLGKASGPSGRQSAAGMSAGRQAGERASLARGEL